MRPPPMRIQRTCDTETVEDWAPLSGGLPWPSTALTVTVNVPSAVEVLAETVNSEVAAPLVKVTEAGF